MSNTELVETLNEVKAAATTMASAIRKLFDATQGHPLANDAAHGAQSHLQDAYNRVQNLAAYAAQKTDEAIAAQVDKAQVDGTLKVLPGAVGG